MSATDRPRNAVALLAGIGSYERQDRIAPLKYASRDARALARVLRDPEVCGFPRDRVMVFSDQQATRARLIRHLSRWLPEQSKGAEIVLIYFAGHGVVEHVGGRDEAYLVPYDADPDEIVSHGVAMSDVGRWIEGIQADAVIVCLDCCHAGGILPREGMSLRAGERDMVLRPSILQQFGGKGRFFITSCDLGQKSIESDDLKHGLFTYHLLRGLTGAGDRDGDGLVNIDELFRYVAAAVSQDAHEKYKREQTPWNSATYNGEVILSTVRGSKAGNPSSRPKSSVKESSADLKTPSSARNSKAILTPEETEIAENLNRLRRKPDLTELPYIFRHLAHRTEAIRQRARRTLSALDWPQVVEACETLAREADSERISALLEGLAALETHRRVIALLDQLAGILKGNYRDRALWLLDRKILASDRKRVAGLFRDMQSVYEIVKVLGPGSCTGAYLARMKMTGLEVVVRVLRSEYVQQPAIRTSFLELGSRAVRLIHHNLVVTREIRALPDQQLYFIVRDYVPGATLREVLDSNRRFEPLQTCKILRQVLEALTPLHREGLAHGGIKPSNIFLTRDDRVILGDPSMPIPTMSWDLPRLAYDFRYVAPEMFRSRGTLTTVSDFYSLGCVAHELFRGQPPFVSDNHFELIARHDRDPIPNDRSSPSARLIDDWLHRMLHRTAELRCPTLQEALESLTRLEDNLRQPPSATISPPSAPPPPPDFEAMKVHPDMQPPFDPAATLGGGVAIEHSSIHLMREQSLMDFAGRESIVPLTQGDSGAPSYAGGMAQGAMDRFPHIPGYEILAVLGRGGMGVVYKARQLALDRIVAIKMIVSGRYAGEMERTRFSREGMAIARLQHPSILQIHELGDFEGMNFLVLEFCDGGSLGRQIREPMDPWKAARLIETLARGVAYAHRHGIIHRDLKPANILFTADGQPKITDFGLARRTDDELERQTITGVVIGTPAYMAPEQAYDAKNITPAVDVYGLGAILYECLTGQPPFHGRNVMETLLEVRERMPVSPQLVEQAVPDVLDAICMKCLQKDPAKRFASAEELADHLHQFLQGTPIPLPGAASAPPQRGRSRSWWRGAWWPFSK